MAGGHGGKRPGAGRPYGSRDKVSRLAGRLRDAEVLRERVIEYLKTNDAAIFGGDSLELAIFIY